jgi:hypothetical protein
MHFRLVRAFIEMDMKSKEEEGKSAKWNTIMPFFFLHAGPFSLANELIEAFLNWRFRLPQSADANVF